MRYLLRLIMNQIGVDIRRGWMWRRIIICVRRDLMCRWRSGLGRIRNEPPRPADTPPNTGGEYLDQHSTLNSQLSTLNNSSPVLGEVHEVGRGKTLNSKRSLLTLPHPLMHLRNFVLYPLADIAPEWRHPILKLTAQELKERSEDKSIPYKK